MTRLSRILARGMLALCLAVPLTVFSQAYPTRPIRMIVPFPPGPALDLVARLVTAKMGESLGQPIVVENRSGANGAIGSELVARAAPDGYTLLAATASTHVTAAFLVKNLPYDPQKDFTPIAASVEPVTCLVVNSSVPANSVNELIDHARRNPGKLSYGSSGVGSVFHMMGELFKQTTGVDMVHVPYKGVVPAMSDVAAGQIPMTFIAVANAIPHMRTGKVRILATLEPGRYAGLPGVPSIVESVPNFHKPASWFGFFGPAGLPQPILARLNSEMVKALNSPDVRTKLEDVGYAIIGNTPEQFGALIKAGMQQYGGIIKAAGIQPE